MFWSIGVMSNLYASSPVKLPCSAYSLSMELARAVGFWDAGPEAIGEDLHMYLKCFFGTEGRVIVKSIFSPASQCNIEGNGKPGIRGFLSGISARYTQAKRHLWGSLDTGYSLRRAMVGILAPGHEQPVVQVKHMKVDKEGKNEHEKTLAFDLSVLAVLFHRLLEAHILMGHMFMLIITSSLILPIRSSISYELATYMWEYLSPDPVHPYVELSLNIAFWVRLCCIFPNIFMIYFYEKYHAWVGFERWALQEEDARDQALFLQQQQHHHHHHHQQQQDMYSMVPSAAGPIPVTDKELGVEAAQAAGVEISARHRKLRVQHLGKRPQLASAREYPRSLFDWISIPIAGFMFYVIPQFHAQLSQLFTESLEYKVAAKPQLQRSSAAALAAAAASTNVSVSTSTTTTTTTTSATANPAASHALADAVVAPHQPPSTPYNAHPHAHHHHTHPHLPTHPTTTHFHPKLAQAHPDLESLAAGLVAAMVPPTSNTVPAAVPVVPVPPPPYSAHVSVSVGDVLEAAAAVAVSSNGVLKNAVSSKSSTPAATQAPTATVAGGNNSGADKFQAVMQHHLGWSTATQQH
jgi:hypothetical protein